MTSPRMGRIGHVVPRPCLEGMRGPKLSRCQTDRSQPPMPATNAIAALSVGQGDQGGGRRGTRHDLIGDSFRSFAWSTPGGGIAACFRWVVVMTAAVMAVWCYRHVPEDGAPRNIEA
jgi:hypothetical protein